MTFIKIVREISPEYMNMPGISTYVENKTSTLYLAGIKLFSKTTKYNVPRKE